MHSSKSLSRILCQFNWVSSICRSIRIFTTLCRYGVTDMMHYCLWIQILYFDKHRKTPYKSEILNENIICWAFDAIKHLFWCRLIYTDVVDSDESAIVKKLYMTTIHNKHAGLYTCAARDKNNHRLKEAQLTLLLYRKFTLHARPMRTANCSLGTESWCYSSDGTIIEALSILLALLLLSVSF